VAGLMKTAPIYSSNARKFGMYGGHSSWSISDCD